MRRFYRNIGKRAFDLVLSVVSFILLMPVLLLIALFIRIDSPGVVLFTQKRLGRKGTIFTAIKFRTMTEKNRKTTREIIGRDPELTRFGFWLRRFKLDELPQLYNIIAGDMSLVGPRPALPEQLEEYDSVARKRLAVRPGLTGLAQVNGNIHLSWPERWKLDVAYVEQMSFRLDLVIILRTIGVVILGEERFAKTMGP